ncbi:dienelactone hydrolase [Amycolatopsis bartoniae]|uniref:Dienelactone hydrolase n=1 Tax=Amycolatopsis bartoniae TaxID=941986 RepID=A0A8H9J5G4_9PSEU|nr:alpha/beta hydrolase [Amycolatopsis bartoniae]MBB2933896.1 dienelactone hydrolase [Amycolatopsis bartoniae]TVS99032.1 alpha/beta hydrolase [Amycolatopsis bartoniae]GHF88303.1 dienelactone hydrolase [Amycolatopsis bartoniae]
MASKPKELLEELSHPGPHDVVRGNLALAGLPGVVFTPRSGLGLPGVAFGHGWLQPPGRYRELLTHLASWGFVAAAPSTQRGPLPSHRLFAADLKSTLDIVTGVRLGPGGISVDPAKLGLAGHSVGGGAAVLAAAGDPRIKAVATIAAAQTLPTATDAARKLTVPGLHLAAKGDLVTPAAGNAEAIAKAWGGPVQLRILDKSTHLAVTEGSHWSQRLLQGKPQRRTQKLVRALFTAFFLTHLTGTDKYRPLLEADVKRASIDFDPSLAEEAA